MTAVEVKGVSIAFGPVQAVDHADLSVQAGERLTIVGPSGSGKTSLLRLIAGFDIPDEGTISLGGQVVAHQGVIDVPAHRRGIGYVAQDGALFPHLSVGDNIAFGLHGKGDRRQRVRKALDLVSLEAELADRRPDQLSGGQQQRVAVARAMAAEPDVLLLDEPFSALEADLRIRTREAITEIVARAGTTAILVTHDPDDAATFAPRVLSMDRGRTVTRDGVRDETELEPAVCPTCGRPIGLTHPVN